LAKEAEVSQGDGGTMVLLTGL